MPWIEATLPTSPIDVPSLERYEQAFLTRVSRGPLRSCQPPTNWVRGAVYDRAGSLVVASQKIGGANGHAWAAADPIRMTARDGIETLRGTWLYGGHWVDHFGHFLLETLTTLWPQGLEIDGVVFHQWMDKAFVVKPYQQRLIDLAGYSDLPLRTVRKRALRVESLYVPSRTVALGGWAHPPAADVFRRIAAPFRDGGGPKRVYTSRTNVNAARRGAPGARVRSSAARDAALDQAFQDAGFVVSHPESLSVDDQIGLYADADVVAGLASSALHFGAACAPPGARVLEVCDDRRPSQVTPNQRSIDAVCGHHEAFIPASTPTEEIPAALMALGLTASGTR